MNKQTENKKVIKFDEYEILTHHAAGIVVTTRLNTGIYENTLSPQIYKKGDGEASLKRMYTSLICDKSTEGYSRMIKNLALCEFKSVGLVFGKYSLEGFNKDHSEWTGKTFTTITDYRAPLLHLLKEVNETIESGEPDEFADMFMLLLSSFRLRFPLFSTQYLLEIAHEKLEINKNRKWSELNDDGFCEHVK